MSALHPRISTKQSDHNADRLRVSLSDEQGDGEDDDVHFEVFVYFPVRRNAQLNTRNKFGYTTVYASADELRAMASMYNAAADLIEAKAQQAAA